LYGRAVMKEPHWHTVAGRKVFEMRGSSGGVAASTVSYVLSDWNLYHKNPGANVYIHNLAITSGYE